VSNSFNERGKAQDEEKEYEETIKHINFEGKVTGKTFLFSGAGIVELDLMGSNCDYYDVRDSSNIWSFVIKEDKAEIIEYGYFEKVKLGDIVYFDGKNFMYYDSEENYVKNHHYIRSQVEVINYLNDDKDVRPKHKL
jgi:lysyl-tRNA synthetase class II